MRDLSDQHSCETVQALGMPAAYTMTKWLIT
jgi:hypothetical protein